MEMKRFYLGTDNEAYVELEESKYNRLELLIEQNVHILDIVQTVDDEDYDDLWSEFEANEEEIKSIIGEENFESAILY